MLWIFEREQESRRIETRFDNATGEYVLTLLDPGQNPRIERFADAEAFGRYLRALEEELSTGRWTQKGPILLQDGWKL